MFAPSFLVAALSTAAAAPQERMRRPRKQPCATQEQVQQLEAQVADLTARLAATEAALTKLSVPTPAQEATAQDLLGEITLLVTEGDLSTAKEKASELETQHAATLAYAKARKVLSELEVVGQQVPEDWSGSILKWFQGDGQIDLRVGSTLVVFWELWCPHCRREVPVLNATHKAFQDQGLRVVGLTRLTRSETEASVLEFVKDQGVGYPIAQENGDLTRAFNVAGIPAAALVKDGTIVWRGHPARLTDELLAALLEGPEEG